MGKNDRQMNEIFVPKGETIVIGIRAANHYKAIWGEDAAMWKPERWLGDGVPRAVVDAKVPGVYSNL